MFNRIIRPSQRHLPGDQGRPVPARRPRSTRPCDILNRPDKKIITAEDPIEYNFDGINQCQVNEKIGLVRSSCTMLRQALASSSSARSATARSPRSRSRPLTGHLVFSTLHTNDAPSAITRLIDMGLKPFLVASSIQAIMAAASSACSARSASRSTTTRTPSTCSWSARRARRPRQDLQTRRLPRVQQPGLPAGARRFSNDVHELSTPRDGVQSGPIAQIRRAAIANGMRPWWKTGMKILRGITTPPRSPRWPDRRVVETGGGVRSTVTTA